MMRVAGTIICLVVLNHRLAGRTTKCSGRGTSISNKQLDEVPPLILSVSQAHETALAGL